MSVAGTTNLGSWLSNQGGLQGMTLWNSPQVAYDNGVNVNEPGAYIVYGAGGFGSSWSGSLLCIVTEQEHNTGLGSSAYWTAVISGPGPSSFRDSGQNNLTASTAVLQAPSLIPTISPLEGTARIDGMMESMLYARSFQTGTGGRCDYQWGFIDNGGAGTYRLLGLAHDENVSYTGGTYWGRPWDIQDWRPGSGGSYQGDIEHAFKYTFESSSTDYLYTQYYGLRFTPRVFIADVS